MRWMTWWCVLGMGCGESLIETPISVAEIEEIRLSVTGNKWTVTFGDDWMDFHPEPCPRLLSNVVAQLDGVDLTVVEEGTAVPAFDGGQACVAPRIEGEVPPLAGASQLELRDGLGTVTCWLGDVSGTRNVALVPPGPWEFAAGQVVTVQWSHVADPHMRYPLVRVRSASHTFDATDLSIEGQLLHFTLPTIAPGMYQLELRTTARVNCQSSGPIADFLPFLGTSNGDQAITITP